MYSKTMFEEVAKNCGLFDGTDSEAVIKNICALDEKFQSGDLVGIYNYILSVSKDPDVLMNVIRLSDRFRDKSTIPYLIDLLLMKEETPEQKERFTNARSMCAKAIANYKDRSTVTPLLYCLNNKDENYKIRLACADALGRIGDRYAVAPLIAVVKDENEKSVYVRETAVSALAVLGDLSAVEPLVGILEAQKGIWDRFTFLKERTNGGV